MDTDNKAIQYAQEILDKLNPIILDAIKEAYERGFRDGKGIIKEGDIEYVDFALPIGKKWGFYKEPVTIERAKYLGLTLPSMLDCDEIIKYCKHEVIPESSGVFNYSIRSEINNNTLCFSSSENLFGVDPTDEKFRGLTLSQNANLMGYAGSPNYKKLQLFVIKK